MTEKNKNNKLILWDTSSYPKESQGQIYTWNGYSESDNVKSLLKYVDDNGVQLRRSYLAWIHELGEAEIKGKRLIEHLAIDSKTSLWWLTSFFEKSAWKTPSIIAAVRIFALEEILKNNSFIKFKLVSANRNLHEVLSKLCLNLNISYEWRDLKYRTNDWQSARFFFDKLPYSLQALVTLLIHVRRNWALRNTPKRDWFRGNNSIFFCSNFIHLDKESCEDGKFYTYLWNNLPELLHNNGIKTNFIQHYLISNTAPNTNVAVDLIKKFNQSKNTSDFHCFLYSYLSWNVIYKVLKLWLKFSYISWQLTDIKKSFSPSGTNFNLWPIMKKDWHVSMRGSASIINYLWFELFDKALEVMPNQSKGLFLCENQSWERALIYAWNKHNHGELLAVAHSTIRFWDLRYYIDSRTIDSSQDYSVPKADITVLNGNLAINAYHEFGCFDNSFVECEALRYGYLDKYQPRLRREKKKEESIKVLILGDYMPSATLKMLELLEVSSINMQGKYIFTIKPHPNFIVKSSDFPMLKLEVTMNPLGEIMSEFDVAYSGNLTTAALDAYLAGLPVIVAFDDTELNFSPLRRCEGVSFVSNSEELTTALVDVNWSEGIKPIPREFFCLDSNLTKWKELLSL